MKFGRTYTVMIDGKTQTWTVAFPLTCKFAVDYDGYATIGTAHLTFYNLSPDARHDIFSDPFNYALNRRVVLAAGYETQPAIPIIFKGTIWSACSYRQGPDWITEIDARDGGFAVDTSQVNLSVPAGYEMQDIFTQLAATLSGVNLGTITGSFESPNSRGITIAGNTWDILNRMAATRQGQAFIHKETVHVIAQNEYIESQGELDTISSDTGLIGSPRVQDLIITANMMFEPRLEPLQAVTLQCNEQQINGDFVIRQVHHRGTISESECGDMTTMVQMWIPPGFQAAA